MRGTPTVVISLPLGVVLRSDELSNYTPVNVHKKIRLMLRNRAIETELFRQNSVSLRALHLLFT